MSQPRWWPQLTLLAVLGIAFLLVTVCRDLIVGMILQFVFAALPFIVILALAGRFLGLNWLAVLVAKLIGLILGAGIGASVSAARSGARGQPPTMLTARLAVGEQRMTTVTVHAGVDGVRHGDRVRAVGPRSFGLVRSLVVHNVTTGRRFLHTGLVRAVFGALLLSPILLTLKGAC